MSASLLWAVPLFAQSSSPNVLFITVDDMRPELPAYGDTHIVAPNFDRLSDQGITFSRAYVQQAICQASRASIMTGTRPDTTEIYDVFFSGYPTFRDTMGLVTTLPGLFKDNGYRVEGYGKNFHHQDSGSWHAENTHYTTADLYQDPVNRAIAGDPNQRPPTEAYDGAPESDYMDAKVANSAVQAIRNLAGGSQPFFLGVGFWKPHLPFAVPQSYWDLYDRTQDTHGVPGNVPISRGADALPPENAIPAQFHDPYSGELGTYKGGRPGFTGQTAATQQALADGTFDTNDQTGADYGIITVNGVHIYPEDKVREMAHGYYACVSFIDAQIGKLLDALEDPNDDGDTSDSIADNTIIVLWGDHGFHLGEDGSWPKHTNMEVAARVPFIIYEPGMTGGQVSDALVEMVDVYPTLAEMAGLPAPSSHPGLEGTSMVPLLNNPAREWKPAAFNQYPKQVPLNSGNWYMGYAMRTDTHRYVQWRPMESTDGNAISLANRNFIITNEVAYEELYDHQTDPSENSNLSLDPAYAALLDAYNGMVSEALANDYANINNVSASTAEAPEALAVAFTGGSAVGESLDASYIYNDPNGDAESGTLLEWVVADDFAGPYTEVLGTGSSYTLQAADDGRYVKLRVTPGASVSPTTGTSVESDWAVFVGTGFADGSSQPAPESAIYEGFDYSPGTMSSASAGGRGWSGGWYGNDGLSWGGNSGAEIAAKTWSVPNGYFLNVSGTAAVEGSNTNTPHRGLNTSQVIDLDADATHYFSYLVNHNGSDGNLELRFMDGTTQTFKLQIQNDGTLDLQAEGGTFLDAAETLSANNDYLILGKLVTRASGNDELHVSAYAADGTVPSSEPTFSASVSHAYTGSIDRLLFGFNFGSGSGSCWDELNIDTNYLAVVGTDVSDSVPTPTVVESFDYPTDALTSADAGGTGWSTGWTGRPQLDWSNSGQEVVARSWTTPTNYGHTVLGNAATNSSGNGNQPFRGLDASAQIDLSDGASEVFFSYLLRFDGTGQKFEHSFYAGTSEVFRIQVENTGEVNFADGTAQFNLAADTDYVIVGRILGSGSGSPILNVEAYAQSETIPTDQPVFTATKSVSSTGTIDRIKMGVPFNQSNPGGVWWDEFYMGATWATVLGQGSGGSDDGGSGGSGEVTVLEDFDYSAGGLSSSNAGGDGWAGGWYGNPALTYAGASGAVAASKTWATPNGYGHAPNGLSGSEGTNGNTPFRELGAAHTIDLSSDTIYFSYLFHYDGTADKFEFAFSDGTGGTNPWDTTGEILKMQVKSTGELGLSGGSFSEPGFTLSTGTDYLVVGKITGNASGADRLAVSFYTASDTVPEAEPTFAYATTATSSAVLDRIKFGVSSGSNDGGVYWDELRFGTSWGAVTGTGGGTPSPSDTAPVASRLGISGHHGKGSTLTGHYLYADAESDTESGSTYRWLHASSPDGSYEAIALANGITYQVRAADVGQFLRFEVTPRSDGTVSEGSTVQSAPIYIGNSLSYGLLSHLEFDHADLSSGVIDSSGNNAGDSTVTGSLTPTTATGNAYRFDGVDDEFSLPFDGQQFDSGFTVAFWANGDPAQLPTNHALTWAISGGNDTLLIAPGWDNGDRMLIRMGESESGYEEVSYTATLDEIAGQWNHWVFSKNVAAGTIDVYLNGEQVAQGTGLHAPIVIEDHWATGAGITVGEVWNSYYPGDLDDYRIYGRALSAAEAQLLFASTDPDGVGDDLTLWRESEFSVLGGTLAPESQTGADPDADGRSNVFEFALGLDPLSPGDPNPVQVTSDGSTGVSGLRFSFPRRTGSGTGDGIDLYEVAGLRYRVKWSSDLIQWFDGSERLSLSGSPVNNGDGTETVWYESDGGADRLFIRVEVEEL